MTGLCPTTPAMMRSPLAEPRSEGRAGALPLTRCRSLAKLADASFTAEFADASMRIAAGLPALISGKLVFALFAQTETGSVQAKAGAAVMRTRAAARRAVNFMARESYLIACVKAPLVAYARNPAAPATQKEPAGPGPWR